MEICKPIFILCVHRSGSTLLKNIIDKNSKVVMAVDEMAISVPYRKTFKDIYNGYNLKNNNEVEKFCDHLFSGKINGTFWKKLSDSGLQKNTICEAIKMSQRGIKDVISIILYNIQILSNKKRVGVKYPLHFSKINLLKEWFPDSKIIFLIRDIRAIIASKINDEATKNRKLRFGLFGFVVHYFTIFFFIFDYIWFHNTIIKKKKYSYLLKYEDLCQSPANIIKEICFFSEIPFEIEMLKAYGKPSSHNGKIFIGFDLNRICAWKNKLKKNDRKIIELLCKKQLLHFGYKV